MTGIDFCLGSDNCVWDCFDVETCQKHRWKTPKIGNLGSSAFQEVLCPDLSILDLTSWILARSRLYYSTDPDNKLNFISLGDKKEHQCVFSSENYVYVLTSCSLSSVHSERHLCWLPKGFVEILTVSGQVPPTHNPGTTACRSTVCHWGPPQIFSLSAISLMTMVSYFS